MPAAYRVRGSWNFTNPWASDKMTIMPFNKWLAFGAFALMILFLVWMVSQQARYLSDEERGAAQYFRALGGKLTVDSSSRVVTELDLFNTRTSDADLARLRELSALRKLVLDTTAITDQGLEHVAALTELEVLYVGNTKISDDGLKAIGKIHRLRELYLNNTAVTDVGLTYLTGLRELRELHLNSTKVTDKGLASVTRLTKLKRLQLANTKVTPEAARDLSQLLPDCAIAMGTKE